MALLGENGVGYELAKKLDSNGAWRSWLGESSYSQIISSLNSLSAWKNFMSTDGSKSKSQIQLQLRVRALLFDKASASLYLRSSTSTSLSPASVQSSYLQLRADDVYYSFEEDAADWNQLQTDGSLTLKPFQIKDIEGTSCAGSRFTVNEVEILSSRPKPGEILDTWYSHWREKHLQERMHRLSWRLAQQDLPLKDRDTFKRTPERMSAYLRVSEKHRNKIRVTQLDKVLHFPNSARDNVSGVKSEWTEENDCSMDEEPCFFPESMFPSNCVPDNSVPRQDKEDGNPSVLLPGVLDNLPYETSRSPLLIERFGMGSEYLNLGIKKVDNMERNREAGKKKLFSEAAAHRARQTIVRVCAGVGFEGLKESALDVFSELLICHIHKQGQILRVLVDNFRNHYTQIDLLRMFLQKMEYSNLGTLVDYVKAPTRLSPQQTPQQVVRAPQPQTQIILPHSQQKLQRQLCQQTNLFQQQNMSLAFQQQHLKRKQPSTPRSGRKMEKDRVMGDARIETSNDSVVASPLVAHQAHWQQQQQLQSNQGSHHPPSLTQFKQHSSLQLPQIHQQNLFSRDAVQMRTQPVKVEGFQELMGGDVSVKQEPEDDIGRTLISPRRS